MRKIKSGLLIVLACLISVACYNIWGYSQSPSPTVQLRVEPQEIIPFEAEAKTLPQSATLTLQAVDRLGNPLKAVNMHLTIETPPKNPWFTTDFPIVEGIKLLELESFAPDGELKIKQMLPIRGTYSLIVQVKSVEGSEVLPFEENLSLNIGENPVKYQNYAILALILLGVGVIGGTIIGKQSGAEEMSTTVRMVLSGLVVVAIIVLLLVNIQAEKADAHSGHEHSHSRQSLGKIENLKTIELVSNHSAIVGKPASFKLHLLSPTTQSDINFKLTTKQEEGWTAFAIEGVLKQEEDFSWQESFFDGSPHTIEVEVSPAKSAKQQFRPFSLQQEIDVEAVAPPLTRRLISLGYMTAFVSLGFLGGLKSTILKR